MKSSGDQAGMTSRSLLEGIFGRDHPRDFAVRLWDGTIWGSEPGQPTRFTLVLTHPGALRAMFLPPTELNLGEAYVYGDFDVEGDVEAIYPVAEHLLRTRWTPAEYARFGSQLLSLPARRQRRSGVETARLSGTRHSQARDKQAIAFHYSRSNEFFQIWLDQRMAYSCAYFSSPDDDLDKAQEHKLEYICRKLRLQSGERLLDIGCGWGGLVIYAAQHYGVRALGITLSEAQAELATKRIAEAGVGDRCQVEVRDYREMEDPSGYDKLVSVGMFEHVGKALLPEYFQRAWKLLRPRGVFLNHGISQNALKTGIPNSRFFGKYVFPDGELVPLHATMRAAEMAGFEVRDVESLREHYALTVRAWLRRLEKRADQVIDLAGEGTYRIWRLYLGAAAYSFAANWSSVYQSLLVKSEQGNSDLPMTRADWYAPLERPEGSDDARRHG